MPGDQRDVMSIVRCGLLFLCVLAGGDDHGSLPSWGSRVTAQETAAGATEQSAAEEPVPAGVGDEEVDPTVVAAESARIAAISKAIPSAVSVFVPGGAGGGSGVLISTDGLALTNFHVSSPAGTYMRCGLADGKLYDAVIVGIDPVGDLALIKLLGRDDFPAAELGDSDQLMPGQWCFVVGNPFLLATNLQPTVTWGMLSGVRRYQYPAGTLLEYADCLQTDASINPGNSGGPLFDAQGRLIGIVGRASFEKRGRVNVGVGYAISINQAKNFLGDLKSGRIVDHATLGATVATDPAGGVRVSNILASSDAYRRGLRYNDELLEIAGRDVQTANDVKNILGTFPKGWRVPIAFVREGQRQEILVRLQGLHGEDELLEKMQGALPPPPPAPPEKPTPGAEEPQPESLPENRSGGKKGADGEPIPGPAAEQIEERRGFANYHFNRKMQQEMVDLLGKHAPLRDSTVAPSWVIRGHSDGGKRIDYVLNIAAERQSMQSADVTIELDSTATRFDAVDRRTLAAVLPALEAWHRLLVLGPKQFGEVVYWGQAPLLGRAPLRHVLVGTSGELEYRFWIHPEHGKLEGIEVFADRSLDPAEIFLQWPTEATDQGTPQAIELRFGTDLSLKLIIDQWSSGPVGEQG